MARKWLIPILILIGVFVFSSQGLKSGPEVSVKDAIGLMKGDPRPVVIDVSEHEARLCLVNDDAYVIVDPHRPEVGIAAIFQPVHLEARMSRV